MASQSLAHSAHQPTGDLNAPALRALRLYEEHGDEILQLSPDIFLVPSQDGRRFYRVQYGEHEFCSCPDHSYRGVNCVHIYCLGIAMAKGRFAHPDLLAGDPFAYPGEESPHGCYDGWVYLGFEVEDENGEHVEEIECVPCRRCLGNCR